jgi:P-type Cu+ transporter
MGSRAVSRHGWTGGLPAVMTTDPQTVRLTGVAAPQPKQWRVVAMAGDGVNEAPAVAQAHGVIALGRGTDVAMESAGVALVQGDLHGMARARRLSQGTMQNSRQNLFLACIDHTLGVPIAAGVLSPRCGLLLSPMVASAAMTCSSVSVMGHALRLRRLSLGWGGTTGARRR